MRKYECMHGWMDGRKDGLHETKRKDGRIYESMDIGMDERRGQVYDILMSTYSQIKC